MTSAKHDSELPVIILGAGGHSKVVLDTLLLLNLPVLGLLDTDPGKKGIQLLGKTVLGTETWLDSHPPDCVRLVNAIGSTSVPSIRREIFQRFKGRGYHFVTLRHPSAIIAADVILGEGAQVMAGAVIQRGARIGCNAIVNTRSSVDHDCEVGDHSHLAPGVTLSGYVKVGHTVHIGTGASVIQSIQIGNESLVAAGAAVISNVAPATRVGGVPARAIRGGEKVR